MSGQQPDTSLAHLQAWMQEALVWSGQRTPLEEVAQLVLPSPNLEPAQRLAIYQRGYYARLLQCLEGQYKALCHALGKDLFRDFATEYLRVYPSASTTLSDLGARFPQWLSENRPDKDEEQKEVWIDFMVELARYEWAVYLFFDKPGHEGLPLADSLTPDDALVPQTSMQLHRFSFPVAGYYHAIADGHDPDIPAPFDSHLVIVRVHYRIGIHRLTQPQSQLLQFMLDGLEAPEALAKLAQAHGKPEEEIRTLWSGWKRSWCEAGFFGVR